MCFKRRRFLMGNNKASYITVDFYSVGIDGEEDTEMWIVNGKAVKPMSGVKLKIGSTVSFYHPNATSYCVNYYDEETQEFWYEDINRNGICSIEVTEKMVYIDAVIDGGGGGGGDIYNISLSVTADTISWNDPYSYNYSYNDPALYVVSCNGMDLCSAYSYEGSSFPRDAIDGGQNTGSFVISAYYNGILVGMGATIYTPPAIHALCTNCNTYQDFQFIYNDGTYNVYQCPNCKVTIIEEHLR